MSVMKTRSGTETLIEQSALDEFRSGLGGETLTPEDVAYEEAREIWNAMIDSRPALIARCRDANDVAHSVNFAREYDLLVSVRGAGHNIAGNSLVDGGLLIDLSQMTDVDVDAEAKTARVQPGATLGDVDAATQAFGLATPTGINSTTGIAGLTIGGGFGWLSRSYGLTIDNLLSANVVTAGGDLVTASESNHPDLFWGIRGGGGNFGIVTSFEYQLHEVGPEVLSGLIVHDAGDATAVLEFYREFAAQAPDELTIWVVMRKAPPLPFLDEAVHGTDVVVLALMYNGDMAAGEEAIAPLRAFGNPVGEHVGPNPYTGWQQAFDPLLTPGARNYWKSHNFGELSDEAIGILMRYAQDLPTGLSEIFIAQMGGATSRIASGATAYVGRDASFVLNVHTRWEDSADDDRCVAWARQFFDATLPVAMGGAYVNFMTAEESGRVQAAYGANYERLVAVKDAYDPDNMFRLNQNIVPSGSR
jgi:FAD/FMN-containing dehydrogenase